MKIYLDNCCFNRPYDDQNQLSIHLETEAKLYVQDLVFTKRLDLVWSYVLDVENARSPFDERRTEILLWRNRSIHIVEPVVDIVPLAQRFALVGLKGPDALHVSCAIYGRCEYFLTVDHGILKRANQIKDIAILSPIAFLDVLKQEGIT